MTVFSVRVGGRRVGVLAVYEPAFVVDEGRPRPATDLLDRVRALVEQDRRDEAARSS